MKVFIIGQQAVIMWITTLDQIIWIKMLPNDMCHTTESHARVNPHHVRADLAKPFGVLALVPKRQKNKNKKTTTLF